MSIRGCSQSNARQRSLKVFQLCCFPQFLSITVVEWGMTQKSMILNYTDRVQIYQKGDDIYLLTFSTDLASRSCGRLQQHLTRFQVDTICVAAMRPYSKSEYFFVTHLACIDSGSVATNRTKGLAFLVLPAKPLLQHWIVVHYSTENSPRLYSQRSWEMTN